MIVRHTLHFYSEIWNCSHLRVVNDVRLKNTQNRFENNPYKEFIPNSKL